MVPQFPSEYYCKLDLYVFNLFYDCQILEKDPLQPNGPTQTSLTEIGPRFVLTPIRIFEGAFGGATVFSNPGECYRHLLEVVLVSFTTFRIYLTDGHSDCDPTRERW